jgi:voltage-gated potassium channel
MIAFSLFFCNKCSCLVHSSNLRYNYSGICKKPKREAVSLVRRSSSPQKSYSSRWLRVPRVILSNLFALFNQFRWPILAFVVVTMIGGYLYGELHHYSGRSPIPLIDRPYTMLQLMILETPSGYDSAPEEWYLMLFWYALPPILVVIIGNGVADFVRLFFGDTWRKVRISNRENHVIVLGAGQVGLRVVRWLRQWGEEVIVIDNVPNPDKEAALKALGAELFVGDARSGQLMLDANIDDAAAFIACTGDDTVNLYAIMRARALNPDIHIVVRVWDDSFNEQIEEFILNSHKTEIQDGDETYTSIISSSKLSAPIFAGLSLGLELTQSFYIAEQAYSAVRLQVNAGSILENKSIGQIQAEHEVDVVLYQLGQAHFQVRPPRDKHVRAGDSLVMFGERDTCVAIAKANRRIESLQGHVVLMGAGHVGLRVIRWLYRWGIRSTVIDFEIEPEVREALLEMRDMVEIIEDDGRDKDALEKAGIHDALAFIAATSDDAINLYAIMRARGMNPHMQIVVRVWDDSFNEQIEEFIVKSRNNGKGSITSVRSSADLAAPIFAGLALGIELTQTLSVRDVDNNRQTNYAAVHLNIEEKSPFAGLTIEQIQRRQVKESRVDVVAHCDGTNVNLAPDAPIKVKVGDTLVIFAELNACIEMAKLNKG